MSKESAISLVSIDFHDSSSSRDILNHAHELVTASKWPPQPRTLEARPLVEFGLNVYDVFLCCIPLVLMAKTILICIVHGLEYEYEIFGDRLYSISKASTVLGQFNSQIATGYTIAFLTIMVTFVKRYVLWCAQRGSTISQLEQFQGSVSLPGTIKMILLLRARSWTSFALLFVWSFYYLGSQASLREFTLHDSEPVRRQQIYYWNSDAPSVLKPGGLEDTAFVTQNLTEVLLNQLNAQFTNAVQDGYAAGSAVNSLSNGFDSNEAALVPWLGLKTSSAGLHEMALPEVVQPGRHGWQLTEDSSTVLYSSFAGLPMWVFDPHSGQTAATGDMIGGYIFNTSYIVAKCSVPERVDKYSFPPEFSTFATVYKMRNSTTSTSHAAANSSLAELDVWDRTLPSVFHFVCKLSMAYVEVETECEARGCKALKVRAIDDSSLEPSRTPFDDASFASTFFYNLVLSNGKPRSPQVFTVLAALDKLEEYLRADLPDETIAALMSVSISQIINTYYTISQTIPFFQLDASNAGKNAVGNQILIENDKRFTPTTMLGAYYNPHYVLDRAWVAIDFFSCSVLFMAAAAAFWLRNQTIAPDIFGYISSLTRDNAHLNLANGGTALDGLERARRLGEMRVRIGDIGQSPGTGVGMVGLVNAESEFEFLQRGRKYA